MTNLSPVAQAVLDAAIDAYWKEAHLGRRSIAAALRAVVEHLNETHAGFDLADKYGCFVEANDILALVAELEGVTSQ